MGVQFPSEALAAEDNLEEYNTHVFRATAEKPAYKKLLAAACCEAHNYIKQDGLVAQLAELKGLPEFAKIEKTLQKIAYWDTSPLNPEEKNRPTERFEEDVETAKTKWRWWPKQSKSERESI